MHLAIGIALLTVVLSAALSVALARDRTDGETS